MEFLCLRFEAPLMSFGAPMVDQLGVIQPWPATSMITGLIGNALGFEHRESRRLQSLQARVLHGSRCDRRGKLLRDFQTVDLGQPYMSDSLGWTTRGALERRKGGSSTGTHIRERDYWADAVHTVALTLASGEGPSLDEIAEALRFPARPLFIGRKPCVPASPLVLGTLQAPTLREALRRAPPARGVEQREVEAWWAVDGPVEEVGVRCLLVSDLRDWRNQVHTGQRWLAHGMIEVHHE